MLHPMFSDVSNVHSEGPRVHGVSRESSGRKLDAISNVDSAPRYGRLVKAVFVHRFRFESVQLEAVSGFKVLLDK